MVVIGYARLAIQPTAQRQTERKKERENKVLTTTTKIINNIYI